MKEESNTHRDLIIDNYKIKQTIGKGTFGKVKLGINLRTNQKVAIKFLEKSKMTDLDDQERAFREMDIIQKFNHENVVKVTKLIETKEFYYIVMEYCENGELFNYIVHKKRLSENEACFFYYQIINGLEYIHSHGVVHRDLKPENLLLGKEKRLKIIDFGLSNYFEKKLLATPCGSPCYASPEMVSGRKYNGFYIDVWSTGIILFAMLCGYLPFENSDNECLYQSILECKIDYPSHLSSISKDLMKKILVTNPEKRIKIEQIKQHQFYLRGEKIYRRKFPDDEDKEKEKDKEKDKGKEVDSAKVKAETDNLKQFQRISQLDEDEIAYMPIKTEIADIDKQQRQYNLRNMLKEDIIIETSSKDDNIQTVPNGPNTNRNSVPNKARINTTSTTKKKQYDLASLIGLNSMRLTTHSPIKKNHLITRQLPIKLNNSIMINNATINVNMIEPNIILTNNKKNIRTKSSSRDNKNRLLNTLIYNQHNQQDKKKKSVSKAPPHKPGISATSLCHTEESVKKTKPTSTDKNKRLLTGNKKVLTNFFDNYHPLYLNTESDHKHSKLKSLKINIYYHKQKKDKGPVMTTTTNTTNTVKHTPKSVTKSKDNALSIKTLREQVKALYLKDFLTKKSLK